MLPDTVVGDLLLEALLVKSCTGPECGVLVDGFPRTSLQVLVLIKYISSFVSFRLYIYCKLL